MPTVEHVRSVTLHGKKKKRVKPVSSVTAWHDLIRSSQLASKSLNMPPVSAIDELPPMHWQVDAHPRRIAMIRSSAIAKKSWTRSRASANKRSS